MNKDLMFSSGVTTGTTEWETPKLLKADLEAEFGRFTLDPASTKKNAKAPKFYTLKEDGLVKPWRAANVFVNPPYGEGEVACLRPSSCKKKRCAERGWHLEEDQPGLYDWVAKAYDESECNRAIQIVQLLPARTDTKWWHEFVMRSNEVYLVKSRITFEIDGVPCDSAPFPSAIVVLKARDSRKGHVVRPHRPVFYTWPKAA
jgi:site-specific DNA-methyltransferase (adenine-specific)